ncbi:MAG: PilZ domain-containing protein [Hyphomicrobiales bacterium]|nr:PilZ domain-containing protein [Hyphomicrobiales bacterium]
MPIGSGLKRKAERRDCHVKAQALVSGRDPVECVIINFSASGARVKIPEGVELPTRFKLFIPSRPETKPALVRWRNGQEIGVEYSSGVADEAAFFAVVERIDAIERALGGHGAAAAASGERKSADAPASVALQGALDRIAKLEAIAEAPPQTDEKLCERVAALEAGFASAARSAPSIENRFAALDAKIDASGPQLDMADVKKAIAARFETIESPAVPTPVVERILRIESELGAAADRQRAAEAALEARLQSIEASLLSSGRDIPAGEPPRAAIAGAGVPAEFVARIADLESRVAARARATPAPQVDLAPLERRIEMAERSAQDYAAHVERFLGARIEAVEASIIAAPPPPVSRSPAFDELERRVFELSTRLDAAPAALSSEDHSDRISNIELSLLELRSSIEGAAGDLDQDVRRRIALLEERSGEIVGTLRNLLALLSAQAERRVAS